VIPTVQQFQQEEIDMSTGTLTTGDDIENALDIIDANGGLGEWEAGQSGPTVERWLFPRFPGAENLGTCSTKGKAHEDVHLRDDKCKKFEVDRGNMYLSRPGIGHDTDVETIVAWLAAPRNIVGMILIEGNPGSGKTALVEAACTHAERTLLTHLSTPDDTRDSLFLRFVGEGKGEGGTPYVMGPVPFAAKHGYVLYGDEWMLTADGVKPVYYELADGRRFLSGGNVDGSPLEVHPDFRFIVSSNPQVRGASLPEPIGSRAASTTITVETSASMLLDLGIDSSIVATWVALGTQGLWRPEIRELRMADYWMQQGTDEDEPNEGLITQATSAFLPSHCPESQREQIRDIVVSYLGGDVRKDGRLVVS
jgi:hypothetical protein